MVKILDYLGVLAGKRFESFLASGVGQAASIENESTAVAAFVLRRLKMKGKTEYPHDEFFCLLELYGQLVQLSSRIERLQFLRSQNIFERAHQRRQRHRHAHVMQQPAQILQGVGHALQKMRLALIKAAKAVGAQGLHDTHVNVGVVVLHEGLAIELNEFADGIAVMIEQLLA